jgi:hypothetical protein
MQASCTQPVLPRRAPWWLHALSVVTLCGLVCGCVSTPRATSELQQRSEPIEFSGLFEAPDVELDIQARNQKTQAWVTFAKAITRAQDPVLSSTGSPYFRYTARAAVPQSPDYWIPHRESRRIEAQVRVAYGERVLAVFDADAESCGRRAQARKLSETEAVHACASAQGGVARVFVASCGGLGEACCPHASGPETCDRGYACSGAGLCDKPRYPLPFVEGFQVDLPLAAGFTLRDAWLVMDDRAHGPKSMRPLLERYVPNDGVERSQPHANVVRLRFDAGFWTPGDNRFFVRGVSVNGGRRRQVESAPVVLNYQLPRALGLAVPGRLLLPPEHFPRLFSECRGPSCKDADGDGLNDLWENVAVHQLRPRLMLDAGDGLFSSDNSDAVRVLASVRPLERGADSYVMFAHVIALSRDYGHMGILKHPGDTEGFGMLFRVEEDGALSWVSSMAKGHTCLTCGPRYSFRDQEFAPDGVPTLYVERDKHGVWQNGRSCREHAAFNCGGERMLRPSAINVGDPSADGSSALVDALDGLSPNGPFAQLAGVFPGEAIWTRLRARVPGRFCGGHVRCSEHSSANQPGNVLADVQARFEQELTQHNKPPQSID